MSSGRMVHSSIWSSESFGMLTPSDKLLFIGLITIADDYGRFKASPMRLRGLLFPYDTELSTEDIQNGLELLNTLQMIVLYRREDEQYGVLPTWTKYQTLRADRMKKSIIPPPDLTNFPIRARISPSLTAEVSKEVSNNNYEETIKKGKNSTLEPWHRKRLGGQN